MSGLECGWRAGYSLLLNLDFPLLEPHIETWVVPAQHVLEGNTLAYAVLVEGDCPVFRVIQDSNLCDWYLTLAAIARDSSYDLLSLFVSPNQLRAPNIPIHAVGGIFPECRHQILRAVFVPVDKTHEQMTLSLEDSVNFDSELNVGIVKIERLLAEDNPMLLVILLNFLVISTQVQCRRAPIDIENLQCITEGISASNAVCVYRDLPVVKLIIESGLFKFVFKERNLVISKELDNHREYLSITVNEDPSIMNR